MGTSKNKPDPVLIVDDIHKSFGHGAQRKEVLRGLSLSIPAGSILSLLGANGAGKTTLVNILSTLILPTSGTATICGHDVVHAPDEVRELISLTGQFAAVDAELSGWENLVFFARLRGLSKAAAKARADELLERFQLTDSAQQLVGSYSGGMRRRLDIAASLIVTPRLLFLDEPTTGLDPLSRRELWEMVEELRDEGVAILLTTQYLTSDFLTLSRYEITGGQLMPYGRVAISVRIVGAPIEFMEFTTDQVISRSEDALEILVPNLAGDDRFLALVDDRFVTLRCISREPVAAPPWSWTPEGCQWWVGRFAVCSAC